MGVPPPASMTDLAAGSQKDCFSLGYACGCLFVHFDFLVEFQLCATSQKQPHFQFGGDSIQMFGDCVSSNPLCQIRKATTYSIPTQKWKTSESGSSHYWDHTEKQFSLNANGWLFQLSLEVPPPLMFPMTVTPLGPDEDCSLKNREPDVLALLVPGSWRPEQSIYLM
ncbi:hypothetical protein STEG23_036628, partial [Scotinomys teguina]